jgi:hypothetical protein
MMVMGKTMRRTERAETAGNIFGPVEILHEEPHEILSTNGKDASIF